MEKPAGEDRADDRRVPNRTKTSPFPGQIPGPSGSEVSGQMWASGAALGRAGRAVTSRVNAGDAAAEKEVEPSSAARSGLVPLRDPAISSPVETRGHRQQTPSAFARLCNSHSANPPTRASFHAWSSWKPWKMMLKAAVKGQDATRADSS